MLSITNNFENFMFDILVFELDSEKNTSPDYDCYKKVVNTKMYSSNCRFGESGHKTHVFTNRENLHYNLKSALE